MNNGIEVGRDDEVDEKQNQSKIESVLREPQIEKCGDAAPIAFQKRSSCKNARKNRWQINDMCTKNCVRQPSETSVKQ